VLNGVSVALDETTREVTRRGGFSHPWPAREIRAAAADNGPSSSIAPFFGAQPKCAGLAECCVDAGVVVATS
jgi:hypothetical protein